jgi:hypothetical protein
MFFDSRCGCAFVDQFRNEFCEQLVKLLCVFCVGVRERPLALPIFEVWSVPVDC